MEREQGERMITLREVLESQIEELEEEQEYYEYGSYSYDVVDGELQYLYSRLSKLSWVKNYSYSVLPLVLLLYFRVL